jgi:hypothetical protein
MLKVEELIEPIASEALIKGIREHAQWKKLYVLPNKSLSKVKQFIENYIRIEKVSLL